MVPSLVDSFKKQNKDPIAGIAPLLWSFTAAFAHVPSHRRLHLYTSLVRILGEREFLFALLVMLADKFGGSEEATDFAVELSSRYDPALQLSVGSFNSRTHKGQALMVYRAQQNSSAPSLML